jgi:hypothetical protein
MSVVLDGVLVGQVLGLVLVGLTLLWVGLWLPVGESRRWASPPLSPTGWLRWTDRWHLTLPGLLVPTGRPAPPIPAPAGTLQLARVCTSVYRQRTSGRSR